MNDVEKPGRSDSGRLQRRDASYDPNHPLERIPEHLRCDRDVMPTEAGREELTLHEWRRSGLPEPTPQDFADARIMRAKSDGPRRGPSDPTIRPRLVMFERNRVSRERAPGNSIPKRDTTARKQESVWQLRHNRVRDVARAMDPRAGNLSDMSHDDDDTVDNDGGAHHNQDGYGDGRGPGTGGGGGGVAA